jgi:DNA-binding response OmpR family regulator
MAARIMVINDTQEILDLFRELLEVEGDYVVHYSCAAMDMGEIERIGTDLILLDYLFGSETWGWQMLQKLRMRHTTDAIPIMLCAAATREIREIEGHLQARGIRIVPKPFNIVELLAAVRQALHDPQHGTPLVNHLNGTWPR